MNNQITVRMDSVRTDIEDNFKNLYCKKDFEYQLRFAKNAAKDSKPQALKKLADMYNEVGIACEYGKPFSYYNELLPKLDITESIDEVNRKIVNTMRRLYVQYPSPEEYLERIVDRLYPESARGGASLELRLLRRFLQTVNIPGNHRNYSRLLRDKAAAEGIDSITEEVFAASETKDEALVKDCYNLAHGVFIAPSSSKELLFVLAFALEMKYYESEESDGYDFSRDVVKNLFIDYYRDNLMRYLVSGNDVASGASDTEPSGLVINPKNFVDAIFLYYLNQKKMTPTERIRGFYRTVEAVKDTWRKGQLFIPELKVKYENTPTETYRNRLGESFFSSSVDEIKEFILTNYYCDTRYLYPKKSGDGFDTGYKGLFELEFTANTAMRQYEGVIELLKDAMGFDASVDFSTMFDEVDHRISDTYFDADGLLDNTEVLKSERFFVDPEDKNESSDIFIKIIRNVERRLNPQTALTVKDATRITRTKLIAAYFHYFCAEAGQDAYRTGIWKSFKDVYMEMEGCLSAYLEDAGYQPISSKNLFDVFTVFIAYCRINDMMI